MCHDIHTRLGPGVIERQVCRTLKELKDRKLVVTKYRGSLTRWILKLG